MQAVWLWPITWTRVVPTCGQTGKRCAHWRICSHKDIERESSNCRIRLHRVRWKTLRVEPSETAASFGEGGGRLKRTDSHTVLKSSELQENTRACRPVLLFSSFIPDNLTVSLQSSFLCSESSVFSLDKDRGYYAEIFFHFCLDLVSRQVCCCFCFPSPIFTDFCHPECLHLKKITEETWKVESAAIC